MGERRRHATKNKNNENKNNENKNSKKRASYALTAVAVPVVGLIGLAYATGTQIPGVSLLTTTIFVDGTKDVLPTTEPYDPTRMKGTLQGVYAQPGDNNDVLFDCQGDGAGPCTTFQSGDNVFIVYPRSAGVLTGPTDPTYDESESIATRKLLRAIAQAQANEAADDDNNDGNRDDGPTDAIYVVGYSQGAGAAAQALPLLTNTDNIEQFVLIANPRRNDGGILTRVPGGYAPGAGVTFGDGTSNPPAGITVIQVTKQYDGIADSPKYASNALADTNAAMGYYYLHPDYYQNVQLDYNGDHVVDQQDFDLMQQQGYATVTSTDPTTTDAGTVSGTVTDVLVLTPVGQLPVTRPLLDAGVPQDVVAAMDPALRAIIEAGYDRPAPGEPYPSDPVRFAPLPTSPAQLQALADQGAQLLAGAVQPNQSNTVQVSQPTPAPLAANTSQVAPANESVLTSSGARSRDIQPAANNDQTDQPSATPPTSQKAPDNGKAALSATSTGSNTGDTAPSVARNRSGSFRTSSTTTETNASTTTNRTATSNSPTHSPGRSDATSTGPSS